MCGIIWLVIPARLFWPGMKVQVAVKVIDDRGNELIVVKKLEKEK